MTQAVIFAIVAAISFGLYSTFQNQASKYINPVFGTIFISLTALIAGILLFVSQAKTIYTHPDSKGFIFAVLAGLFAFGIDLFALKAYGSGLPVSIGGPIIIAGSIAVVSVIGFFLGESFSVPKIVGIFFVIVGIYILTSLVK